MNLRILGDSILTQASKPVESFDSALDSFLRGLRQACVRYHGIGLAAPQIGLQRSILVYQPLNFMKDSEALINPEILETSGTCVMEEGCLSIPGFFAPVERPQEIFVQYRLPDGEYADAEFKGRDARVIQHEIDHLCGTLFLDKILPDDRKMALRAFGIEPQE